MIIGISGHRPDKLPDKKTGYNLNNPVYKYIRKELENVFSKLKPDTVISGMALGVDSLCAEICIEKKIPFIASVPFKGQELYWSLSDRNRYFYLLEHAERVEYVSPGGYASWKMQVRNQWIVDNSDILVAVFAGIPGGTKNCIDYAESKNKKIIRINPLEVK